MGKIDHNHPNVFQALGLSDDFMDDIRESFSATMAFIMTHQDRGTQDSKILYEIFTSLKKSRWDKSKLSKEDIELEMYSAGFIVRDILDKFKDNPPVEIKKGKTKLPPGMPPKLVELIQQMEAIPGAHIVVGKDNDIPEELKEMLGIKRKEEDVDTSIDNFFTESVVEKPSISIQQDEPITDLEALEQSLIENIDKVSDAEIRYFVDVLRDCEEKCPFDKRMSCPLFKRYEQITEGDED